MLRKFCSAAFACLLLCVPLSVRAEVQAPANQAKAAILTDCATGVVLYEKNADQPLPIASITKVMTLNLVFEALEEGRFSLEDQVPVSEHAAGMGGSQAFLDAGYSYPAAEIIKSIILASANDGAVAMAELLAGSEETFVAMMNRRAGEWGMTATHFMNCSGLPQEGHEASAKDVAVMSAHLLNHADYYKWSTIWMDSIRHDKDGRETQLVNTNKLVRSLQGCDGIKTGSTSEAGFCVSATALRNNVRLIAVVLGESNGKTRFADAAALLNFGFANFENKLLVSCGEQTGLRVELKKGLQKDIGVTAEKDFSVLRPRTEEKELRVEWELPESVTAPVKKGDRIGTAHILEDGTEIGSVALLASENAEKAGFFDRLGNLLAFWR